MTDHQQELSQILSQGQDANQRQASGDMEGVVLSQTHLLSQQQVVQN